MMTRRRAEDPEDDSGVLRRGPRDAWRLGAFLGGFLVLVLAAVLWIVAFDKAQARTVAKEEIQARVGPLEKRFDDHETRDVSSKELTDYRSKQIADSLNQIQLQIQALCRASARPQVCLGEK